MDDELYMCITGAPADQDLVCAEHGETACLVGVLAVATC